MVWITTTSRPAEIQTDLHQGNKHTIQTSRTILNIAHGCAQETFRLLDVRNPEFGDRTLSLLFAKCSRSRTCVFDRLYDEKLFVGPVFCFDHYIHKTTALNIFKLKGGWNRRCKLWPKDIRVKIVGCALPRICSAPRSRRPPSSRRGRALGNPFARKHAFRTAREHEALMERTYVQQREDNSFLRVRLLGPCM